MPTQPNSFIKNILQLNLAMLLVSTSGVLGRAVTLPPVVTIGWRALLAVVFLMLFLKWKKISFRIAKEDRKQVFLGGILMGIHWVAYFKALQLSNVAIGMLTIFTYPALTSILEPLLLRLPFQKIHLFLGLLVLGGIALLIPDLDFENEYTQAVAYGLGSALAYALRNILMKKQVANYHGSLLMLYQALIIGVLLIPFSFQTTIEALQENLIWILALALFTTALGHTLFLLTFRYFSITTASIISSVQPVYGILLGVLLLGEVPKLLTIIGGLLIISAVVIESLRSAKEKG
ncbi:DMT family transporter [Leeuwenhoekiella polynyae]|uniref:Threonine/homoserine efflux transporter RhtA n=1 Tax=Leeuwenhoekiella polynyae TaxID=1550906 RepID=A0A4Q0NS68_9FLAO|nr:threonine/homoserine efflux transporter RhtA [Leeuwenhoekiella polynyae]